MNWITERVAQFCFIENEDFTINKIVIGRARSGLARAESLSKERRSEIARNAAIARHEANRTFKAIRKGNFLDDFGFEAECYVLDDAKNTAVMTKRGMAGALGLKGAGGLGFTRFLSGKNISKFIGPELKDKIENPIIFQLVNIGPGNDGHG